MPDPDPIPGPASNPTEEPRATGPALEPELITTELAAPPNKHDPYAALRSPNYRAFALGFVTSSTGLQMLSTGIAWEIYELTHDPLSLGFAGLARAVPVILFALPAGQAADIFNRKHVLIATQSAFAVLTAILAAASWLYWHGDFGRHAYTGIIYALLVLTGCRSFNGPSRNSLVPQIVEPEVFHNAVTWNSGVFQFSATGGPLIAGALIAAAHAAWPVYLGCALACLTFAISASFLRPRVEPRPAHLDAGSGGGGSGRGGGASILSRFSLRSMTAGAGHLWQEKTILAAITLDLFAVLLGGATALMPVYAKDILHVGPVGLGALRSAPSIGAFLMAMALAHRPPFERAGPAFSSPSPASASPPSSSASPTSFWLSLAMLILTGAFDNISVVIRHILVQVPNPRRHARPRLRRQRRVHRLLQRTRRLRIRPGGQLFDPVTSVVSGGIGTIVVVLGMAWWLPEIEGSAGYNPKPITPTDARIASRTELCRFELSPRLHTLFLSAFLIPLGVLCVRFLLPLPLLEPVLDARRLARAPSCSTTATRSSPGSTRPVPRHPAPSPLSPSPKRSSPPCSGSAC